MVKGIILTGVIFVMAILILPSLLVTGLSGNHASENETEVYTQTNSLADNEASVGEGQSSGLSDTVSDDFEHVSVFRSSSEIIEEVPLEEYIAGVVASEMPAAYEMEALKAQALTARTYLIRQLMDGHDLNLPEGADITDTEMHQVFKNEDELQEMWAGDFEWKMTRIRQAVYETEGQVITYEGEPITATFFSTSNGYTENSEEYWENSIPYLRSVESPWDLESPRYSAEQQFDVREMEEALQVALPEDGIGEIISRTTGGRVAEVSIGDRTFTGRDIRDALDLDSSDFTWSREGDAVTIETRGWGHGVGMSQFGADSMAKEGHTYRDIILYYYHDVAIEEAETVLVENKNNDSSSG